MNIANRVVAGCVLFLALWGLARPVPAVAGALPTDPPGPVAQVFSSADLAVKALIDAAQAKDRSRLFSIFGSGAADLIETGAPVAEDVRLTEFVKRCGEKLTIENKSKDMAIACIGTVEWPFPIPIVRGHHGWSFDAAAGREELVNRWIGKNELTAIDVCKAYVEAQREYVLKDQDQDRVLEYARKMISTPGQRDGLFWEPKPDVGKSPLAGLAEIAQAEGYTRETLKKGAPAPFHGYFFRILTRQGGNAPGGPLDYVVDGNMTRGFALLAYPAKWGVTGVMTFTVAHDGTIYEKNLGEPTERIVRLMRSFNPDSTWKTCR